MMRPVIYSQEALQSSARRSWTAVPGSAQHQSSLHTQQRKTGQRGAWCYSQASHLCWPFRSGLGYVLAPHWFPFPLPSFLHPPLGPSPAGAWVCLLPSILALSLQPQFSIVTQLSWPLVTVPSLLRTGIACALPFWPSWHRGSGAPPFPAFPRGCFRTNWWSPPNSSIPGLNTSAFDT